LKEQIETRSFHEGKFGTTTHSVMYQIIGYVPTPIFAEC
jgi:hypothetical protein